MTTATHPQQAALLADIAAAPDDDAPKLLFADWLEEQYREYECQAWRWIVRTRRLPGMSFDLQTFAWYPFEELRWHTRSAITRELFARLPSEIVGTDGYSESAWPSVLEAYHQLAKACAAHLAEGGILPELIPPVTFNFVPCLRCGNSTSRSRPGLCATCADDR